MRTTLCLAAVCVLVLAGCKPSNFEKPGTPSAKTFTPAEPTPSATRATTVVPAPEAYPDARYYDSTNLWTRPALSRPSFYDAPKAAPVAPKAVVTAHPRAPVATKVATKAATSKVKLASKARKPSTRVASKTATRSTKTAALAKKPAAKSSKTPLATRASSPKPKPADASGLAI